nr:ribonucleases P/MRP protein subunit POP1 isoform X1 [Tanacetum cinerariifolium]
MTLAIILLSAVQLEGLQESLLSILSTIMTPFPPLDAEENVISGDIHATTMLHHGGASKSNTIAPVIYMWRPIQQSTDTNAEGDRANEIRQLWIWIHAAAFNEGYNALKIACESQGKVEEDSAKAKCTSLEGKFGTLEVMGSKASQLLQKILHPLPCFSRCTLFFTYSVRVSTKMHSSRFCPVLLLRRNDLNDSVTRWSIMLPLSWVKAFWVPMVSFGAQAIGLRERSWVATEGGIPNFPSEFPECGSYASLVEVEAATIDKEASLRPASAKPCSIPIPPPWNCVRLAFQTDLTKPENRHIYSSAFDIVVARSPMTLFDHYLLFIHHCDRDTEKCLLLESSFVLIKKVSLRMERLFVHHVWTI